MTRSSALLGLAILLVSACAPAVTGASRQAASPSDVLYLASADPKAGIAVVDGSTGATLRTILASTVAPDWSRGIAVARQASSTFVRGIEPKTGARLFQGSVPGAFDLPSAYGPAPSGLSSDGSYLALVGPQERSGSRVTSRFAVVSAKDGSLKRAVDLEGDFSFDAISDDGTLLYLIEHPEGGSPTSYFVRVYDLAAGQLGPAVYDVKVSSFGPMNGRYHSSLAVPKNDWYFSLYFNPTKGPFVHALNVQNRYASCILDLPGGTASAPAFSMWAIAHAPTRRTFFVANGATGAIAEIGTQTLEVYRKTATLPGVTPPTAATARRGAAAVSPDGHVLYTSALRGVLAIDTSSFAVAGRWAQDREITGLATSADGKRIYAVTSDGTVLRLDAATGTVLAELTGFETAPATLLRVE